jgi:hypothetical protein
MFQNVQKLVVLAVVVLPTHDHMMQMAAIISKSSRKLHSDKVPS